MEKNFVSEQGLVARSLSGIDIAGGAAHPGGMCNLARPATAKAGFVESLLALSGLDWPVPDCSTLCRRQKASEGADPHRS